VYFVSYYGLKARLEELWGGGVHGSAEQTLVELVAGGCAGVCSWGCIIPIDVVKTRLQASGAVTL